VLKIKHTHTYYTLYMNVNMEKINYIWHVPKKKYSINFEK